MAANTIATVSTLPPAPTRADAPADFTAKADTFVAALPGLVTQVNLTVKGMNDQASYLDQLKSDVNGYKTAAAQSAETASTQAGNAQTYAGQAMGYRDSAQTAAAAAQSAAGMPSTTGKADFMLSVNAAGNGVEWRASVPRPTASAVGKVARVNSAGNGYELADGSPISEYFESSRQSATAGASFSVQHGLGVVPKIISAYIVCVSPEQGYSAGDMVEVATSPKVSYRQSTSASGLNVYFNSTSLICQIANAFEILGKGNTTFVSIDASKWSLVLRAAA